MFKGSLPALVTPFRNGALDLDTLKKLIEWHIGEGSSGLVPVGTTGESPTLSHAEHETVVEEVVKAVAGRIPVIAGAGPVALLGSSLGGFYATWLAEHHDLRAAIVNPAVRPWRLLDKYTGIQHNYHTGEAWEFNPAWLDELKRYEVPAISQPENLLLLTQTGDETLDWEDGWDYYGDCHRYCGLGGSHGFDNFDAFIPLILRFCGIEIHA